MAYFIGGRRFTMGEKLGRAGGQDVSRQSVRALPNFVVVTVFKAPLTTLKRNCTQRVVYSTSATCQKVGHDLN